MVSPTTKNVIAGVGLFGSVALTFNGFVWQMQRRRWKDQLIDSFSNMSKPAIEQLPKIGETTAEYIPVKVKGTLDNEGSVVVGPRPMPNKKDGRTNEEARAGFLILTPFEEEETGVMIMVNRGWVPIDAAKSRIQRVQYTGDGFKHIELTGFIRKEERIDSWWYGDNTDANNQPQIGTAWLCCRPYEMLRDYYGRRWGANQIELRTEKHGSRHWMVEMMEDHTGEDQRMIKGTVYPMRRTQNDLTHTSITPLVHGFYAGFWLSACFMSLFMMRKVIVDQRAGVLARKARDSVLSTDTSRLSAESAEFHKQVQHMTATGGNVSDLKLPKNVPRLTQAAIEQAAKAAAAAGGISGSGAGQQQQQRPPSHLGEGEKPPSKQE